MLFDHCSCPSRTQGTLVLVGIEGDQRSKSLLKAPIHLNTSPQYDSGFAETLYDSLAQFVRFDEVADQRAAVLRKIRFRVQ
jgi:hypothetical protein